MKNKEIPARWLAHRDCGGAKWCGCHVGQFCKECEDYEAWRKGQAITKVDKWIDDLIPVNTPDKVTPAISTKEENKKIRAKARRITSCYKCDRIPDCTVFKNNKDSDRITVMPKDCPLPDYKDIVDEAELGCTCQCCGLKYRVDLIIDNDLWEKIKPAGKAVGAGLLCGSCIMKKLEALGNFGQIKL